MNEMNELYAVSGDKSFVSTSGCGRHNPDIANAE
jgi:hypothetical protein